MHKVVAVDSPSSFDGKSKFFIDQVDLNLFIFLTNCPPEMGDKARIFQFAVIVMIVFYVFGLCLRYKADIIKSNTLILFDVFWRINRLVRFEEQKISCPGKQHGNDQSRQYACDTDWVLWIGCHETVPF